MLVAEGFVVALRQTRRPHTLIIRAGGQDIWSNGVWRRLPSQEELAQMVRETDNGV